MGLMTGLLTLPLAPVRGVVWLAERIRDRRNRSSTTRDDPRQLAQVDEARAAGELSEDEAAELQENSWPLDVGSFGWPRDDHADRPGR